jgi:predicted  nucleic acid-binding Zn-ribbon protein
MTERKDSNTMSERLSALEKELARVRRQNADMERALDDAKQRVIELESARDQALDRIDWAIDSLHNVLDQG